jgi:sugar lactone lactonase YvrE
VIAGALRYRPLAGEDPVPGEIVLVTAPGSARVLSSTVLWPNGIGVDPTGRLAYVSDYARGHVLAIDLGSGGEDVFCSTPSGAPDGLAVDGEGGVWVALGEGGGVARFTAEGELDEIVEVPAGFVSSISFGGADLRDVLVSTADNRVLPHRGGTLLRGRSEIAGLQVAAAAI